MTLELLSMPGAIKDNSTGRDANAKVQEKVKWATEVFDEYGDIIRNAIYLNVNNRSEADDIYQDLFLSLVHRPIPRDIQYIRGYLYRAIKHDVLDAVRRTKSYRAQIAEYAECCPSSVYGVEQKDPQNIALQAEEIQRIIQIAQSQLPRRETEAVLLRYARGQDTTNAAKTMHINKRSFARYLCMGLKKIRQFIRENKVGLNDLS